MTASIVIPSAREEPTMALFSIPEKSAAGILGFNPNEPPSVPEQVQNYLETAGHLDPDEQILAALDDSWLDDGNAGLVATDSRFLAYKKANVRFEVTLEEVRQAFFRRYAYPRSPLVGRGGAFGKGPIVVLRLKFDLSDGTRKRLRVSQYARDVFPIVSVLLERLGDRVQVGRLLPGI